MRILPALPGPVLLAVMIEPLLNVTDCPAMMLMLPPVPSPVVLVEMWPPFSIITVGADTLIWPALPVAPKSLLLLTMVERPETVA